MSITHTAVAPGEVAYSVWIEARYPGHTDCVSRWDELSPDTKEAWNTMATVIALRYGVRVGVPE